MEVGGDALAVLDEGEVGEALMEAGVLDGDGRRPGERDGETLVLLAELGGALLLGQVEVAEHLAPDPDGHAQEGPHRWVVRREPVAVGVGVEVGEPQGLRVHDEQAEDTVALGEGPDGGDLLRGHAHVDELGEAVVGAVEHAQRAVLRVEERHRGLHDPAEGVGKRQVGADREHRLDEVAEPRGVVDVPEGHQLGSLRRRSASRAA